MNKLSTEEAYHEVMNRDQLTIAVFKTTWCPDCHFIDPFMPELEQKYDGKVNFVEIDRDELPEICSNLNILGIPSFVAFRKGEERIRFVNKMRKSREEIEQFIERAIQIDDTMRQV